MDKLRPIATNNFLDALHFFGQHPYPWCNSPELSRVWAAVHRPRGTRGRRSGAKPLTFRANDTGHRWLAAGDILARIADRLDRGIRVVDGNCSLTIQQISIFRYSKTVRERSLNWSRDLRVDYCLSPYLFFISYHSFHLWNPNLYRHIGIPSYHFTEYFWLLLYRCFTLDITTGRYLLVVCVTKETIK